MKISKKTLGIIFGSIAGASIIAGGTMFGVGGNQTTTISFGGVSTTYGSGMINFESAKVGGVTYGEYIQNLTNLINNSKDTLKQIKDGIAMLEKLPPGSIVDNVTVEQKIAEFQQMIIETEDAIAVAHVAITMNNLAIAGAVIMSLGLATGVIIGAIALFNWKKSKR